MSRSIRLSGLLLLLLALPASVAALDEVDDAYRVSGAHAHFGTVSGYLRLGQSISEVWLEGPGVLHFHRAFSFLCPPSILVADALVVEECHGPQNARFLGGYTIDATGAATGPAFGKAILPDLDLTVSRHT